MWQFKKVIRSIFVLHVAKLIEDIGFVAVDTGSLREGGRKQQPGSPIYNNPMTIEIARKRLAEIA
jgi:hypothetical protein